MFDTHIAIVKIARDTAGKLTAFQELWSWLPDEEVSNLPTHTSPIQ